MLLPKKYHAWGQTTSGCLSGNAVIMGHLNNSNSGSAMSSRFKGKKEEMFQEFHAINLLQKFNILSKRYDTNTGAFQYFQTQSVCLFYLSTLFQFPFILITVFYLENHKNSCAFCFCCPLQLRLINLLLIPALSLQLQLLLPLQTALRTSPKRM